MSDQPWFYSSRGPGENLDQRGRSRKPDLCAPTPKQGSILYGKNQKILDNGWGTSGACPQVAGLKALLLSVDPNLSQMDLQSIIRESTDDLGYHRDIVGAGLINCEAAVLRLLSS